MIRLKHQPQKCFLTWTRLNGKMTVCSHTTRHVRATHPPTGPVEGTLEHRPQLAGSTEAQTHTTHHQVSKNPAALLHRSRRELNYDLPVILQVILLGGTVVGGSDRDRLTSEPRRVRGLSDGVVSTYLVCWANPGTLVKMFMSALRANEEAP